MATDLNTLMCNLAKTPDGMKVFKYILESFCGVSEGNTNYDNALKMARQEGRRSVGIDMRYTLGDDLYYAILSTKV